MSASESLGLAHSVQLAAQFLVQENPIASLSIDEAIVVVSAMRPKRIPAGTVFITEGESQHIDFMVLILSGDVLIESRGSSQGENTISLVGPGNTLGEMSLIDGLPRLTSCKAQTDLSLAILSRARLRQLLQSQPEIAAKFLLFLHIRASEYARTTLSKFNKVLKMNDVMHQQLDVLMNARPQVMPSPAAEPAANTLQPIDGSWRA